MPNHALVYGGNDILYVYHGDGHADVERADDPDDRSGERADERADQWVDERVHDHADDRARVWIFDQVASYFVNINFYQFKILQTNDIETRQELN